MNHREPIRVLFLNHSTGSGGAERSLLELIAALDPARVRPLVGLPDVGWLGRELTARGVPMLSLPLVPIRRSRRPRYLLGLLRHLHACASGLRRVVCQVDLIHANGNNAHVFAAWAAPRLGRPIVWHSRDLVALKPIGGWLGRRAERIVAISETVHAHLAGEIGSSQQLVTVMNGIDVVGLRARSRGATRPCSYPEDTIVLATLGQMVPWKRQDVFLEAAAQVAKACPRARFLVVGDVPPGGDPAIRDQLMARAAAPDLAGRVTFTGRCEDVARLLPWIDGVVHPATREPFGRIVAEAMALECPVIATKSGGPAEIIADPRHGILIESASAPAFATAMLELAGNQDLRRQLAMAGRQRIERDFDVRRVAQSVASIYDDVTGGK